MPPPPPLQRLYTRSLSLRQRPLHLLPRAMIHSSPSRLPHHLPQNQIENINQAISYHQRTKHSLTSGYARGPGRLDWANQPNPFLRFIPSPSLPLIHPTSPPPLPYHSLFNSFPSPPLPLSYSSLSSLLYYSLSLSAWKSTGFSTWSLRVNPSSGNLHPTECHILSPPLPDSPYSSSPFLCHYSPKDHSLEVRTVVPPNLKLPIPDNSLIAVFSSIFWREAWKYGERALRYCNHDVGHAIAALAISAGTLGWDAKLTDSLSHSELEALLGVTKTYPPLPEPLPSKPVRGNLPWVESQHPDCALVLFPANTDFSIDYPALREFAKGLSDIELVGKPNSLSKDHVCWDVIYRTAEAIKKPGDDNHSFVNPFHKSGLISDKLYNDFTVHEVVRKRRSAVDMDRVHLMERETFYQILLHCLPSGEVGPGVKQGKNYAMPFRVLDWDAEVHLALFVHRVKGLEKGLYFLVRNEDHFDSLKKAMRLEFEWARPDMCPAGLPLYKLAKGDCQDLAKQLSCIQDIASDGCFSLGMVARFEPVLNEKGSWMYPRLFWETGVIGQEDEEPIANLDISIKGKRKENGDLFLRLRICDNDGRVRNIYFPFDAEGDTALSVATEMVAELDITDHEVTRIADMIDSEIASLVPDWKPGPSIDETPGLNSSAYCHNCKSNASSCSSVLDYLNLKSVHCTDVECTAMHMHGRFEEVTYQVESPTPESSHHEEKRTVHTDRFDAQDESSEHSLYSDGTEFENSVMVNKKGHRKKPLLGKLQSFHVATNNYYRAPWCETPKPEPILEAKRCDSYHVRTKSLPLDALDAAVDTCS